MDIHIDDLQILLAREYPEAMQDSMGTIYISFGTPAKDGVTSAVLEANGSHLVVLDSNPNGDLIGIELI